MPSLKALKNRIGSVKNTRKITKAMQMVAAAKLRRAQDAAEAARPYAERMSAVMAGLTAAAAGSEGAPRLLAGTGEDRRHLLVVLTSERGLAGGFNSSIVKLARVRADELRAQGKDVAIMTVGKKAREQMKRDYSDRFVHHVDLSEVKRVGYDNARAIAEDVLDRATGREPRRELPGEERDPRDVRALPPGRQPVTPPPVPVSEKVTFAADAFFDFDKSVLKPEGKAKLDDLAGKMQGINLEVIIAVGHTDSVGTDAYNQKLSVRRAEGKVKFLAGSESGQGGWVNDGEPEQLAERSRSPPA
mgnify:CR=1 FL=1